MDTIYNLTKFGMEKRKRRGKYLECKTCHKIFYVFPSRLKIGRVKFCSQKCRIRTGYNNPFYGKKHLKKTIAKIVIHPNFHKFGKGSDNYNNIRFGENYIGKSKPWWQKFLLRKYGRCQICGFDDKRILIIHHKDRNKHNNVENNLLLLCPNCHAVIHYDNKDGMYSSLGRKNGTYIKKGLYVKQNA